jgi:hypothetical protein
MKLILPNPSRLKKSPGNQTVKCFKDGRGAAVSCYKDGEHEFCVGCVTRLISCIAETDGRAPMAVGISASGAILLQEGGRCGDARRYADGGTC